LITLLKDLKKEIMKQKVEVRFPNECYFEEIEMDLNEFKPVNEFDDEVFGWFGDIYISMKKHNNKQII